MTLTFNVKVEYKNPKMSIPEFMSDLEIFLHHTPLGVPSIVTGDLTLTVQRKP